MNYCAEIINLSLKNKKIIKRKKNVRNQNNIQKNFAGIIFFRNFAV